MPNDRRRLGPWRIYPDRRELRGRGKLRTIEPKAMTMLMALLDANGATVSRAELEAKVWPGGEVQPASVNRLISELRRALDDTAGSPRFIQTVPRLGYRIMRHRSITQALASLPLPVILATLLLVVIIVALWAPESPTPLAAKPTLRPLTSAPGYEAAPSFSARADQLVYMQQRFLADGEFQFDLKLMDLRETDGTLLTDTPGWNESSPVWNPANAWIAYVARSEDHCQIRIIDADDRNQRIVSECGQRGWQRLAWSPDGMNLAMSVSGVEPGRGVTLIDTRSGEQRELPRPPTGWTSDEHPIYSVDGRSLFFVRGPSAEASDVWRIALPASPLVADDAFNNVPAPLRLTSQQLSIRGIGIGPEGHLLIANNQSGRFQIWHFAPDGSHRPLPVAGRHVTGFAVSSVGPTRIVYEDWDSTMNLWSQSHEETNPLFTANSTQWEYSPTLDPSGQRLAFVSDRSGHPEVYLLEGANLRQLTRLGSAIESVRFVDENALLFSALVDGVFQVFRFDTASNVAEQAFVFPGHARRPGSPPESDDIWFSSNASGRWELYRYNGQDFSQETEDGGFEVHWINGATLFSKAGKPGLWRKEGWVDIAVLESLQQSPIRNFTTDSDRIVYLNAGRFPATIESWNLRSGKHRILLELKDFGDHGGLAVRGERVIYTQIDRSESDLWLLEYD